MGLLSWLRGFLPSDAGFMVWDSKELRWARGSYVGVFVAGDALPYLDAINDAVLAYREVTGDLLQLPVAALDELVRAFKDPELRKAMSGVVLVARGPTDPKHGESDIEWDRRTGLILNVLVTLPVLPDPVLRSPVIIHEFGHVHGLAHDDDPKSVMYPRTHAGQGLSDADRERLRRAYG